MYFDTGATGIAFTEDQLKKLNIPIPDDAVVEQHGGIGGSTTGRGFTVSRMRLGPIDKSNVQVSALQSANMRHGLLGQTFYSDFQYTIDTAHNTIRFVRR
jgi:predicted aspartyl protease